VFMCMWCLGQKLLGMWTSACIFFEILISGVEAQVLHLLHQSIHFSVFNICSLVKCNSLCSEIMHTESPWFYLRLASLYVILEC